MSGRQVKRNRPISIAARRAEQDFAREIQHHAVSAALLSEVLARRRAQRRRRSLALWALVVLAVVSALSFTAVLR